MNARLTDEQRALAHANRWLAVYLAKPYMYRVHLEQDKEDLISASMMGLCESVITHDPARGAFATHAKSHCLKRIREYLRGRRLIRVPVYLYLREHAAHRYQKDVEATREVHFAGGALTRVQAPEPTDPCEEWREALAHTQWASDQQRVLIEGLLRGDSESQIAKRIGLTRQRINQIKQEAIERARPRPSSGKAPSKKWVEK